MIVLRTRAAVAGRLARLLPRRFAQVHARAVGRVVNRVGLKDGDREESLRLVDAAAAAYRHRPYRRGSRLALVELLGLRASVLQGQARVDEALASADEAIAIAQSLPETRAVRRELAAARTNRAAALQAADRPVAALAEAELAVSELREPRRRTRREQRRLVLAHQGAALALASLDRPDDALAAWQEAVAAFRRLPWFQRLSWVHKGIELRIDLAWSLWVAGERDAALAEASSVDSWAATLDSRRIRGVRAGLALLYARQQLVLALAAAAAGRHEQAGPAAATAAHRYRASGTQHPAVREGLALALECQSRAREELGHDDPVTPARECVEVYTRLADDDPDRFAVQCARSLAVLSDRLSGAGAHEESVTVSEQALARYDQLPVSQRGEQGVAATALIAAGLAGRLHALGDLDRALEMARRAVSDARALDGNRTLLHHCLGRLDDTLWACERDEEALSVALERLPLAHAIARGPDPPPGTDLVLETKKVGVRLWHSGRGSEAAEAGRQMLAIVRERADSSADSQHTLATAEDAASYLLLYAERPQEAVELQTLAIDRWRQLGAGTPSQQYELAIAMKLRSAALDMLERYEEALLDLDGAIDALPDGQEPDGSVPIRWSWLADRARLRLLLGRDEGAVSGIQELRRLARESDLDDAGRRVERYLQRVHDADPERLTTAWQAATGQPWSAAIPD